MRIPRLLFLVAGTVFFCCPFAISQTVAQQAVAASNNNRSAADAPPDIERIVRSLAAKETQFRRALTQYSFKREAVVQTIGQGKQITGEYFRLSRFIFDDSGVRFEKIDKFPVSTLTEIR